MHEFGKAETDQLLSRRKVLVIKGDTLFLQSACGLRRVTPPKERFDLIKQYHTMLSHLGTVHTQEAMEKDLYWKNMARDVGDFVGKCEFCLKAKDQCKPKANLIPSQSSFPFQRISMDITGPLPLTIKRNRYILGLCDYFSNLSILTPMKK